ncbi:MAG: hypothetical protein WA913_16480 [Pricia sp.]
MKQVIIKIVAFVGLFFALDWGLGLLIGYFHDTSNNINLRDANYGFLESPEDDILIFGASELSHALISSRMTEKTGLSTYNLACDACGIYYQYPLLETILDKHSPKAIILSSNQMNAENLRYLSKLYPFYRKNEHAKQMIDELRPNEFFKLALQGYVYNSQLIRVLDSKDPNLNGYVPLPAVESKRWITSIKILPPGEEYHFTEKSTSYFRKFVQKAQSAGATVYVFLPPTLENMDGNYHRKLLSHIEKSGAKSIDFSNDRNMQDNRSLFFDRTHLNDDGAQVMTDKVLQVLKQDGVY